MCSALFSAHDFKNDVYFMCSALVWPRGLKNDECYAYGFKNDVCFMCSALVSSCGFKNDESYLHMALRTTHISCVAR